MVSFVPAQIRSFSFLLSIYFFYTFRGGFALPCSFFSKFHIDGIDFSLLDSFYILLHVLHSPNGGPFAYASCFRAFSSL
jgi:hypothetical protein